VTALDEARDAYYRSGSDQDLDALVDVIFKGVAERMGIATAPATPVVAEPRDQAQLAAQLSQADSNTAIAVGLLALDAVIAAAILTVGFSGTSHGDKWGWPLVGFGIAAILLGYVLIRKSYKLGPRPPDFFLKEQGKDEFDFNRDLMQELQEHYGQNETLLNREQLFGIYPALIRYMKAMDTKQQGTPTPATGTGSNGAPPKTAPVYTRESLPPAPKVAPQVIKKGFGFR
jgi:hypothetical protein